ncbi:MAG: ParB/RepB/Spo0J family partition protein [Treponema sp.]|jgi:ParB family chromosome partitioning protein|nr:ParB/RepB/Spo0J family partition protein [Treponema sp.]
MQIPIKDIKVKRRIRKEMGSIEGLAESMKRFGQISPIVLSKSNVLIAGCRRLEAAKLLGWKTINSVIADIPDSLSALEYEIEENSQRLDFNNNEIAEAGKRLERLKNPRFFRRIWNALVRFFKRIFHRG